MANFEVKITDNADELKDLLENASEKALMRCGALGAEMVADVTHVEGGMLRNSITYALGGEAPAKGNYKSDDGKKSGTYNGTAPEDENPSVYIGTNVEYAVIEETRPGHSYLKRGLQNSASTFKRILQDELENA